MAEEQVNRVITQNESPQNFRWNEMFIPSFFFEKLILEN
jgi:hypothetical protein